MYGLLTPPCVLLFDVNKTLLDIEPLLKAVADDLLNDDAAKLVFTTMPQFSLVGWTTWPAGSGASSTLGIGRSGGDQATCCRHRSGRV